ncbi:MAG: VIT family protein [Steroidobacteraceae bacterium]
MTHEQSHKSHRVGWLRAAVLGANDGIVSTASLIVGVATANISHENVLLTGTAGLVAGAMSMAAGEYVSVRSQADTERADLELERRSIQEDGESETNELAQIYRRRGLSDDLAQEVARRLMKHDALGAHARDDIGITEVMAAKPIEAAVASALMFSIGAVLPLLTAWFAPLEYLPLTVASLSLVFLASLGALAAIAGGAPPFRGAVRVTFWGTLAMALTAGVGKLFGVSA